MKSCIVVVALFAVAVALVGCKERNEIVEPVIEEGSPFYVVASDYSTNYFFVDTTYIPFYEPFFLNDLPEIREPEKRIVQIEVWIEELGLENVSAIKATSLISIGERGFGYPSSLRDTNSWSGTVEKARFRLLSEREFQIHRHYVPLSMTRHRTSLSNTSTTAVGLLEELSRENDSR